MDFQDTPCVPEIGYTSVPTNSKDVADILKWQLKLPFLEVEVVPPKAVEKICPVFSHPEFILRVLYNFHCEYNISKLITERMSCTLIEYFTNIHLRKDENSLVYLKGLPLYLTLDGQYTSLGEKTAYIWPQGMCTVG